MPKSIKLKNNYFWNSKSIVHGSKTLDSIIDELCYFKLWENTDIAKELVADKKIILESDKYDGLEIFYQYSTTNSTMQSKRVLKGKNIQLDWIAYSTGNLIRRTFTIDTNNTDIIVKDCLAGDIVSNNQLIPIVIYGFLLPK